jgi:hypothetical protein
LEVLQRFKHVLVELGVPERHERGMHHEVDGLQILYNNQDCMSEIVGDLHVTLKCIHYFPSGGA